jgi:S1-C subfamily serine protease
MVVLAGNGHLAYGAGIPSRVARRLPVSGAIVLQSGGLDLAPDLADFVLLSEERKLPPPGTLGVVLEPFEGVHIAAFATDSAAHAAGLRRHDQILAVNNRRVASVADVKAMLWDKSPGDRVKVTVSRGFFDPSEQQFEVELRVHEKP